MSNEIPPEHQRSEEDTVKKIVSTLIAVALVAALTAPAIAGDEAKQVELTGYITDEWCGAANANSRGAGCARDCAEKGSELAIYAEGKMYRLSNKKLALQHLGYEVVVRGTVDEEGVVKVQTIEKADKKT